MRIPLITVPTAGWLGVAVLATQLAGCQLPPTRPSHAAPLQLIGSAALDVPESCETTGSVVVDFVVLENGATGDIRPAAASECLQQALTAWVASFRYAPVGERTQASVEWLLVEAKKGS